MLLCDGIIAGIKLKAQVQHFADFRVAIPESPEFLKTALTLEPIRLLTKPSKPGDVASNQIAKPVAKRGPERGMIMNDFKLLCRCDELTLCIEPALRPLLQLRVDLFW